MLTLLDPFQIHSRFVFHYHSCLESLWISIRLPGAQFCSHSHSHYWIHSRFTLDFCWCPQALTLFPFPLTGLESLQIHVPREGLKRNANSCKRTLPLLWGGTWRVKSQGDGCQRVGQLLIAGIPWCQLPAWSQCTGGLEGGHCTLEAD